MSTQPFTKPINHNQPLNKVSVDSFPLSNGFALELVENATWDYFMGWWEYTYEIRYSDAKAVSFPYSSYGDKNKMWYFTFVKSFQAFLEKITISDAVLREAFSFEGLLPSYFAGVLIGGRQFDDYESYLASKKRLHPDLYTDLRVNFFYCLSTGEKFSYTRVKELSKNLIKVSEKHVFTTADQFIKFLDTVNVQYGFDDYDLMKSYGEYDNYSSSLKSQSFRDYVRHLLIAAAADDLTVQQLDGKVEDLPLQALDGISNTAKFGKAAKNIANLPSRLQGYRDFLLGMSVRDFRRFILTEMKISRNNSVPDAIAFTHKSLEILQDETDFWDMALSTYDSFLVHVKKMELLSTDYDVLGNVHKSLLKIRTQKNTLTLIKNFYDSYKKEFENVKDACQAMSILFEPKEIAQWLSGVHQIDRVAEVLYESLGVNCVEVIREVANSETKGLTADQWEGFAANHETYKDTPVSWWSHLV